eukprot:Lithocolla_globosa_v1_NODE_235_length_4952_cov_23.562883.p1 type:complete len:996 gc:universal NODE_235_length_4952_cov_23.562883:1718-4705(+)
MVRTKKRYSERFSFPEGVLPSKGEVVDFYMSRLYVGDKKHDIFAELARQLVDVWKAADIPSIQTTALTRFANKSKQQGPGRLEALFTEHSKLLGPDVDLNVEHGWLPPKLVQFYDQLFDISSEKVRVGIAQMTAQQVSALQEPSALKVENQLVTVPGVDVGVDLAFYFDQLKGKKKRRAVMSRAVSAEYEAAQLLEKERQKRRNRWEDNQRGVIPLEYFSDLDLEEVTPQKSLGSKRRRIATESLGDLLLRLRIHLAGDPNALEMVDLIESQLSEQKKNSLNEAFPEVDIRLAGGEVNPDFVEAWVEAASANPIVGARSLGNIFVTLANKVFQQSWKCNWKKKNKYRNSSKDRNFEDTGYDGDDDGDDSDDEYIPPGSSSSISTNKKSKSIPARSTMGLLLEDASLVALELCAGRVLDPDNIVTFGMDEVTKQTGGRGSVSAKVDNITLTSKSSGKVRDATTGIHEMSTKDANGQRTVIDMVVQLLGIFGVDGESVTKEEIEESVDFWMADREAACNLVLDEYSDNADGGEKLNCNAHVCLAIIKAILQVLSKYEQDHKLFRNTDFLRTSPSSSMFESALYVVTKLFSHSHVNLTYTLSNQFSEWLGRGTPLKKAKADRFGRLTENCFHFLQDKGNMFDFLEYVGSEANLLSQMVEDYLETPWMEVAASVVIYLSQLSELPLLQALNVDDCDLIDFKKILAGTKVNQKEKQARKATTHEGLLGVYDKMKMRLLAAGGGEFEPEVLAVLTQLVSEDVIVVVKNIVSIVAPKVWAAVEHQIEPLYGQAGRIRENPTQYLGAPTTNLKCEGSAGWFGVALRSGASVPVVSAKRSILVNDVFGSKQWQQLSRQERIDKLKATRTDQRFLQARAHLKTYQATLMASRRAKIAAKAAAHQRNLVKLTNLTKECAKHGGPIKKATQVDALTREQLALEFKVLRKEYPSKNSHFREKIAGEKLTEEQLKKNLKDFFGQIHEKTSTLSVAQMQQLFKNSEKNNK